ncbi:hypothetical protein C8F01DRAFT_1089442 [Mycena amicta]|nr:hypothetical protein C8F01DRAFT_1089442 [Mycena amicta]
MANMWLETWFYGIYLVLFCICIHILRKRAPSTSTTVLLATAIILFFLSTVQLVINLYLGSAQILEYDIPFDTWSFWDDMIYVLNNLVADSLLIYRCWVVWNRNYLIIAPGILGLIATNILGFDPNTAPPPFFALTLATNVFITFLTAGRIWWIYYTSQRHLKSGSSSSSGGSNHYTSSIAIVLESGLIYSAFVAARLAVQGEMIFVVTEMLRQVVGIVPTLIIVRVSLGVSIESSSPPQLSSKSVSLPFHVRSGPGGGVGLDSENSFMDADLEPEPPQYYRIMPPLRKESLPDAEKNAGSTGDMAQFVSDNSMEKSTWRPATTGTVRRPLPQAPGYVVR